MDVAEPNFDDQLPDGIAPPLTAPTAPPRGVLAAFANLEDPRTRTCPFPLDELLFVALCAVTSGADDWVMVVEWAELKLDWLRRYLPFANGIASHDTFSRVFSLLDAKCFEACFIRWMGELCPSLSGQLIPIDGKSVRRSHNGSTAMTHLVSAWSGAAGLVLGQVKTAAKSNEITAIPELLDALDVRAATITIDAMGCQHAIVDQIVHKQAHYIIAVKDNQPTLAQAIESMFPLSESGAKMAGLEQAVSLDKGHGRIETRRCVVARDISALGKTGEVWTGLKSLVMIESTRETINGKKKGESSTEWRYYISSLCASAVEFNQMIRSHWGIDNSLHWVLDLAFKEDDSRIRIGDGAQNFAVLRRITLNLLKQDKSRKSSMRVKRYRATCSLDYLETVMGARPR